LPSLKHNTWTPSSLEAARLAFDYTGQLNKPRLHIHRAATDGEMKAFSKEVWRLKDFIESNRIAVLKLRTIQGAWIAPLILNPCLMAESGASAISFQ
jgi:hypothetical protein